MQRIISLLIFAVSAALLILQSGMSASAVTLPEGAVEGLPSALTIMDDSGNAVSEDGEYFFEVTDMQPYTDYTKDIQIMNLMDDKSYHIYFYAEPVSHDGDIDLNAECKAVFTLNGQEVFSGDVNGNPDDGGEKLSDSPIDLGSYAPGESGKLTCTITWNGESADLMVDYGSKLVSKDGTYILEEATGNNHIDGEVYFRWVFCAVADEETVTEAKTETETTETETEAVTEANTDANSDAKTDTNSGSDSDADKNKNTASNSDNNIPNTGVFSVIGSIFAVIAGVLMVMSVTSRISTHKNKKKRDQEDNDA